MSSHTEAVSGYDYESCHYAVSVCGLVFRSSLTYRRQDSLVQCWVQFIRTWRRGRCEICYLWMPCL